jgi:signal recognition particle GTPase
MTWYFQHQRAQDIIAEHQREAARIQLARLYDEQELATYPEQAERSPVRRAIGGAVLAIGEAVTRVGRALDGAESNPTS